MTRPVDHRVGANGDGSFYAELVDDKGLRVASRAGFKSDAAAEEWAVSELSRFRAVDEWERRS